VVTDQTFVTASYQPTLDYFTDRPGEKTLLSHEVLGRVAHAFTPTTTVDLMDFFQISKIPNRCCPGWPAPTRRWSTPTSPSNATSLTRVFSTNVTAKADATVKMRSTVYRFDNATLGQSLDRTENLYGLAGSYDLVPEAKGVAEYRYETINYRSAGDNKDKTSHFLLEALTTRRPRS